MRKLVTITVTFLLVMPLFLFAQTVLDNFDNGLDTTRYNIYLGDVGTYLRTSVETNIVQEGNGALRIEWQNRCYDMWGGWIGLTHIRNDSGFYDFTPYTHLSLWYYNEEAQSKTGEVEFRIILNEGGPGTSGDNYETWMSHHWILDDAPGWHQIKVELKDVGSMSSDGFWLPGNDWGLFEGDGILELDKIIGWTFEFSQGNGLYQQPDDSVSGIIILDNLELTGVAPMNLIFFNGKAVPNNVEMSVGWSGSVTITDEEDAGKNTTSIKWTTGSSWDGVNFTLTSPKNLMNNWQSDSVQFKIKAPAGIGDLLLAFSDSDEDGDAKEDYAFQATYLLKESEMNYDNTWKQVKIPLSAFDRFAGVWDDDLQQMVAGEFDSTKVQGFAITGNGQENWNSTTFTIYLDDIWTGNPVFDWIPPAQVTGVSAVPDGAEDEYYNLVYWTPVEDETGETYNVYASEIPFTDVHQPGVEIIAQGITEDVNSVVHMLYYPLTDHPVTYYYAVECVDVAGNVGPAGFSDAVTNTAKGVATIADHAPPGFKADGDFSEWNDIKPWELYATQNNIAAGDFTDDDDLTATVWLAMDDDYFYVAADVIDNVFSYDPAMVANWWTQDAFELFIGLWDQNGKPIHNTSPSDSRGAEPDYKLIFLKDRYYNEYKNNYFERGTQPEFVPGSEHYYFEEFGGKDWALEAKIPLDSIAFGDDVRFHPQRGMRIMFDLVFHDNDGSGWEGNLSWSENNRDLAYLDQHEWTFTWIGDTNHVPTAIESSNLEPPVSFTLLQNFPNPFNPKTTIVYSLAHNTQVTIEVFDVLGRKVKTLTKGRQAAGWHKIEFDAYDLSSGIYFYKIEAGHFTQVRKMLLVK